MRCEGCDTLETYKEVAHDYHKEIVKLKRTLKAKERFIESWKANKSIRALREEIFRLKRMII